MNGSRLTRFTAVLAARNREFLRDRSSWAWNIIFPVVLVIGLALVFSRDDNARYTVAVFPAAVGEHGLHDVRFLRFTDAPDIDVAVNQVARHQADLLIDNDLGRYWINDTSPNGYLLERVLLGSGDRVDWSRQTVGGAAVRYVDWVVPGVLAMNMMFSCLFGVGYVIVRYRKSGVLRRLKATPLGAVEFIAAQVVSRLWLIIAITVGVFVATNFFLQFTMEGSYFTLTLVFLFGAISLISLGLLVSARTASEELAGGLLNVASWPMMLLSGVWFSLDAAPNWLRLGAELLPLTHVIRAARNIMIDGATLIDVLPAIVALIMFSSVFVLLSARLFRWE